VIGWARGLPLWLSAIGAGCSSSSERPARPPTPTPVRCEAVSEQTVQTQVRLQGTVAARPNRTAVVSSAVPGRIASMHVLEGDKVAKGELLAVVENPSLAPDRDKAVASVDSARAARDNAQSALARQRRLFDQGIAARRAVEDAETRLAVTAADLKTARAQQRLAAQRSALAQVRAPIAGTVVKVTRGIGELVDGTPATPIVQVADTSVLELSCDVASADLVRIVQGVAAAVRLDALPDQSFSGKVARVAPTVDPSTSLGRVRIELSPPSALVSRLHIGMGGRATITTGRRKALVVAPSALRRAQDGHEQVVVCAQREGETVASVRDVAVGVRSDAWIEITRGPPAGTLVVVDRALGLEDGTRITPRRRGKPGALAR